eukprot:gene9825-10834_t
MGFGKADGAVAVKKGERNNMAKPDPKTEIRKLPYRYYRELAELLDKPGDKDWKKLISVLPEGMYTINQVGRLEQVGKSTDGSAAYELLTDLGHQLLNVKQLIGYLSLMNHQEALLLLKEEEPVRIVKQPVSICIEVGRRASLKCLAKGFPQPNYQWIKDGCDELETGIDKELIFKEITLDDAGEYTCRVSNPISSECTIPVIVEVTQIPMEYIPRIHPNNGPLQSVQNMGDIHVTDQLPAIKILPGQYYQLSCGIEERPDLQFYWLKNAQEMPGENRNILVFNSFQVENEGYYSCRVVGADMRFLTKVVELKLDSMTSLNRQFATGKVALVIGNQDYVTKRAPNLELVHPVDDARTLTSVLYEMGFKVLCLVNLDRNEMMKAIDGFCELLRISEGMYGLFYFGGHGYEEGGKTYLVPVDAPKDWTPQNTVCADEVLSQMQQSKTKLDVLFLDVCRRPSGSETKATAKCFDPKFYPGAQSVICYATCPQSQAFEKGHDMNGMYVKHLVKHIGADKKIEDVVFSVHSDVAEEAAKNIETKGMSPTYRSSTTKVFSLCDKVLHDIDKDPTLSWFEHHRLPAAQLLEIENGISTELRFEPVCSNVSHLILHVTNIGDSTECDVILYDISEELQVNKDGMNFQQSILPQFVARSNPYNEPSGDKPLDYENVTIVPNVQKLRTKMSLTFEATYKARTGEQKKAYKVITITRDEFGITGLFE